MRNTLLIFMMIFVSGCCTVKNELTGCDHPSGWCSEIRHISQKSWKYAQLSKNVYNKKFQYNIDNYFLKVNEYKNENLDFFSTLYQSKESGNYILVYRGTDSLKDFKTGNNPFNQQQNQYAIEVFDQIEREGKKIDIVAGHSLGGGMSIHVSLNRDNVTAYSFNGSPVFRNDNSKDNERYSIVEFGEILKFPRVFGREATQLYTSIGCENEGGPIDQHDMIMLADCLTQIAAIDDSQAKGSLADRGLKQKYAGK